MAEIRKRVSSAGRKSYVAVVRRGGMAKSVSKTFTRRADAVEWATKLEADTERAIEISEAEAYRVTVSGAVAQYLAQYTGKDDTRPARLRFWTDLYGHPKAW